MTISLTPELDSFSNQISNKGFPLIGTKHFGIVSVNGLNLVPNPAANKIAFNLI